MKGAEKQKMVDVLMEKDERTIATALLYAEAFLKYGVDVTKKWETAVEQKYALQQAERCGFLDGMNTVSVKDAIKVLQDHGWVQCMYNGVPFAVVQHDIKRQGMEVEFN